MDDVLTFSVCVVTCYAAIKIEIHFYEQSLLGSVSQSQVCIRITWKVVFLGPISKEFDTVSLGGVLEARLFDSSGETDTVGLKNIM